jgi:Mg/Co/Ni transporter MgtE
MVAFGTHQGGLKKMARIGRALLVGAVVGLVVGCVGAFLLPALGLSKFTFPAIIGTASGFASSFVRGARQRRIPLPTS